MHRKKIGFIESSMRNRNIVMILTIVFMAIGVVALKKMPRNEFPKFTIRQGVVVGVYPGATSAEVEAQMTRVVENYIFGYQEVKKSKTYSQSKEGIMYIFVELNDNVKNADEFWSKFKHGLSELKMSLPSGVLALIANSDFGDTSALLITLSSDTKTYKELEEELKKLESECRKIPAASKIKHFGLQKEKIYVNVKPEKLNEYNIKSISLLSSYQMNGMVNYAGELKDGKSKLAVHFPTNFESEKDLAAQIVYSDPRGDVVRLKDIATIERRYEDPDNYIKQNGRKSVLLSLEMQPGNNIVEFGQDVDKALQTFQKHCPKDVQVTKISELPKYVDESISNFMHEFIIAIIAVILVTMVLLPFRVASVAGITVPISVLITLSLLYFLGIELHTVSLAALIIVLGMIVDNSIVVIDNHVEKLDHGYSTWHAAIKSAKELLTPIIVATLAIFTAYFPLMIFLPGTSGEFVYALPQVIGIALVVSIVVAVLLVPYLNYVFIKKGLNSEPNKVKKRTFLDVLQSWFDQSLALAFRYPKTIVFTGLGSVALAVVLFKGLEQQLFPQVDRNQFAVEVYLPTGSALESTANVIDSLQLLLTKDKRITNITSFVGTSSPRFHSVYAPNMPASNYGQLLINTISSKATKEIVKEYGEKYADHYADAHVKFKILAMQLTLAPIEIRIVSDSIKDIRTVEEQINKFIRKTKHIAWARSDWDQMQQNVKVNIDRDKANRLGMSKGLVSTTLMTNLDGMPLTTIWENDYPVQVRLAQESKDPKNIKLLENQYITSPTSFSAVPLRSLSTFSPEWTEGTIVRRNGVRTLTIRADNDDKVVGTTIFNELKPQIDRIKLPEGTSINYGGDDEAQGETLIPMAIALGLSIVIIFFILLFQFKKVKLSLLIMSTMLLGLPGAAIGLTLTGYAFSMTAFIGITSLCGMVVRNGIILIDYARELREKHKFSVLDAALAAGKRRMRPIFLTSAAASVGVIPMIMSRSTLWGPLGTVICFGLLISMVLTLYILPVLYFMAYSDKPKKPGFWSVPAKTAVILLLFVWASNTKAEAQILSLDSCKRLALANNKKIKEANLEVKASEEQRKSAFTNYFPQVSALAVAMRSPQYLVKGSTPQMNLPVYDGNLSNLANASQYAYVPSIPINTLDYANVANLMVAMPLYVGGRIRNGNKLAALGEEVSRGQQTLTTTEVLVRTEELYWTYISLKEKEITLHAYEILLDTLVRDVHNYESAGLAQRNDLLKVQLKQNELKNNMLKLQNGIKLTTRALCQHIGIEYDSTLAIQSPAHSSPFLPEQVDAQKAIANRVEYQLLNKAVEANDLQRKMTMGEYMPQVSLAGVGVYMDVAKSTQKQTLALLNLNLPISDWWSGSHKINMQRIKVEKAKTTLEETSELLSLQVEQTSNELHESLDLIKTNEKSVEQAKENLRITNDNYRSGAIGISDLLEAQALYQSSKDNLSDSQCTSQIKKAKYMQATGQYK